MYIVAKYEEIFGFDVLSFVFLGRCSCNWWDHWFLPCKNSKSFCFNGFLLFVFQRCEMRFLSQNYREQEILLVPSLLEIDTSGYASQNVWTLSNTEIKVCSSLSAVFVSPSFFNSLPRFRPRLRSSTPVPTLCFVLFLVLVLKLVLVLIFHRVLIIVLVSSSSSVS